MFKILPDLKMQRRKTLRTNSKIGLPCNPKRLIKRNSFNDSPQITNIVNSITSN
jgi:hypothetical protein